MEGLEYGKFTVYFSVGKTKTYNKITKAAAERHVAYIRSLDDNGNLELCGASEGYPGVAGIFILKADSLEEAKRLCSLEPFAIEGFVKHKVSILNIANRENNYLL